MPTKHRHLLVSCFTGERRGWQHIVGTKLLQKVALSQKLFLYFVTSVTSSHPSSVISVHPNALVRKSVSSLIQIHFKPYSTIYWTIGIPPYINSSKLNLLKSSNNVRYLSDPRCLIVWTAFKHFLSSRRIWNRTVINLKWIL